MQTFEAVMRAHTFLISLQLSLFVLLPNLAFASENETRLLFDSNVSGSYGIYSSKFDGSDLRALIDSERHELSPDPSPDGKQIAYVVPYTLTRESSGDIWIMNRDGSANRMLIRDRTFPTFSADGKKLFFLNNQHSVGELDLSTLRARRIFPKQSKSIGKYKIVVPRVSADGKRLAFASNKPNRWNVKVADLASGKISVIGRGCQPAWYEKSTALVWITSHGALERTGIIQKNPLKSSAKMLHDHDRPFGHEYFPTLALNDSHLLFAAASPGKHDHLFSDYQIFIKNLLSGDLTQVTSNSANNRWPKILR